MDAAPAAAANASARFRTLGAPREAQAEHSKSKRTKMKREPLASFQIAKKKEAK
jgi:hypothetical protein